MRIPKFIPDYVGNVYKVTILKDVNESLRFMTIQYMIDQD